jgi:hypothetical protein
VAENRPNVSSAVAGTKEFLSGPHYAGLPKGHVLPAIAIQIDQFSGRETVCPIFAVRCSAQRGIERDAARLQDDVDPLSGEQTGSFPHYPDERLAEQNGREEKEQETWH